MHVATESTRTRIWVWLVWALVMFTCLITPPSFSLEETAVSAVGVALQEEEERELFPWWSRYRWKKWTMRHYQALRQRYRRAQQVGQLARLALRGMVSMAQVVDWLTASQLRYQLGALPVLYALLETLNIRDIINRHCPTEGEVNHGTVAQVLILNRLMFP